MNAKETLIYLAIAAIVALVTTLSTTGQVDRDTFFIFCLIGVPVLVSYYFRTGKTSPPSSIEIFLATAWLVVRRVVAILGAMFFSAAAVYLIFRQEFTSVTIGAFFFSLFGAALCILVMIYGQGWSRGEWRDDVELHKKNKERYKWRW